MLQNAYFCKNRSRYIRKRATFCRNLPKTGNYPTSPPLPSGAAQHRGEVHVRLREPHGLLPTFAPALRPVGKLFDALSWSCSFRAARQYQEYEQQVLTSQEPSIQYHITSSMEVKQKRHCEFTKNSPNLVAVYEIR